MIYLFNSHSHLLKDVLILFPLLQIKEKQDLKRQRGDFGESILDSGTDWNIQAYGRTTDEWKLKQYNIAEIKKMCVGVMGEEEVGETAGQTVVSSERFIVPPTEYSAALAPTKFWSSISCWIDGKQMTWDCLSLEWVLLMTRNALGFFGGGVGINWRSSDWLNWLPILLADINKHPKML